MKNWPVRNSLKRILPGLMSLVLGVAAVEGNPVSQGALSLSQQISENYEGTATRPKVAVLEFSYLDGRVDNVGRLLAEELITDLFVSGRFAIVERSRLNAILEEHELAKEGLVSQEALKSLGKLLGARAVVTGTLVEDGQTLKVSARVISTETGILTAVARTDIGVDSQIETLRKGDQATDQLDLDFVSQVPDNLFMDSFDGSLTGWRALGGDWLVVDGKMAQNSLRKPAFIVAGDQGWKNYSLKLKAQKIDGEEGFLIGVRTRGTASIVWNIGGWRNSVSTVQVFSNLLANQFRRFNVVDTPISVKTGKWYTIEISINGATLRCYLDGAMLVQHTDPEYLRVGSGNIGIGTWGTRAYFDDIEVKPLD